MALKENFVSFLKMSTVFNKNGGLKWSWNLTNDLENEWTWAVNKD